MRNITVTLDDALIRRAKVRAAAEDSTVTAVVRRFLEAYANGEMVFEQLQAQEEAIFARLDRTTNFRGSDRLSRDDVHLR
jgi:plasmid stability protein